MSLPNAGHENATQISSIARDQVAAVASTGDTSGQSTVTLGSVGQSQLGQQQNTSLSSAYGTFSIPLHLQMPVSTPAVPPLMSHLGPYVPSMGPKAQTPGIFLNQKLRSGKWIPEEERYADLLIEYFDKGLIMECDNGATLRSYLSRKLHCAPMRISKKYAGKGIGKKVFLTKMSVRNFQGITANEIAAAETSIREAEGAFYKAIFPNAMHPAPEACAAPPPQLVCPPNAFPGLVPLVPAPSTTSFPQFQPFVFGNTGVSVPPNPLAPKNGTTAVSAPVVPAQAPTQDASTPALQLQQSYLTALQQINQQTPAPAPAPTQTLQNQKDPTPSVPTPTVPNQQHLAVASDPASSSMINQFGANTAKPETAENPSLSTISQAARANPPPNTTLINVAPTNLPGQVPQLQTQNTSQNEPSNNQEQASTFTNIQNVASQGLRQGNASLGDDNSKPSGNSPDLLIGYEKVATTSQAAALTGLSQTLPSAPVHLSDKHVQATTSSMKTEVLQGGVSLQSSSLSAGGNKTLLPANMQGANGVLVGNYQSPAANSQNVTQSLSTTNQNGFNQPCSSNNANQQSLDSLSAQGSSGTTNPAAGNQTMQLATLPQSSSAGGTHEAATTANQELATRVNAGEGNTSTTTVPAWGKKSGIRVTADSYALFAQESAVLVSQHSAYVKASSMKPDHGLCFPQRGVGGGASTFNNSVADAFKSVSLSLEDTMKRSSDGKRSHDVAISKNASAMSTHQKTSCASPPNTAGVMMDSVERRAVGGAYGTGSLVVSKKQQATTDIPIYASQNVSIDSVIVSGSEPLSSDNASSRESTDDTNAGFEPASTTESENTSNDSDSSYEKSSRKKARIIRRVGEGTSFVDKD